MKLNLNYFTAGTVVKVIKGILSVLVVLYLEKSDHKSGRKEIRLPGGTVQFIDIIKAIKEVAERISISSEKLTWLINELNNISMNYTKTAGSMPANNNAEKLAIRKIFTDSLSLAEQAIESVLIDSAKLKIIEAECRLQTLKRELHDECAVTEFGSIVECGHAQRGTHEQISYLIMESDSPDSYAGSGDDDIIESTFMPVSKVYDHLYKNHKPFLNSTLNKMSFILGYDESKKDLVKEIDEVLKKNI